MAHLLSFVDTTPQLDTAGPLKPSLPPPRNINASTKTALLVENDESLLSFMRRALTGEGYAVRTAANSEEGLRLYRHCAPFNVVLIDYCVPQNSGVGVDFLAPVQTNGIALAIAIRKINPSQGIIIAALDYRDTREVPRPQELMDIPVLIDISNFRLRSLLEKIEVDRAIELLTPSELLRLQHYADFRVRVLGRAARGRTGDDLLAEAMLRTLIGAEATQKGRHWNKDVDFVIHLIGAMQSISSSWRRQFTEKEAYLISELPVHDAEGQEHSPLDNVASAHAPADQLLIDKDDEDQILTLFKNDHEATQVLVGLLHGLKKNEIGLDKKKYAATEKRIRTKLLNRRNGRGEKV
jgi:CheY-like chemotaxis protein